MILIYIPVFGRLNEKWQYIGQLYENGTMDNAESTDAQVLTLIFIYYYMFYYSIYYYSFIIIIIAIFLLTQFITIP